MSFSILEARAAARVRSSEQDLRGSLSWRSWDVLCASSLSAMPDSRLAGQLSGAAAVCHKLTGLAGRQSALRQRPIHTCGTVSGGLWRLTEQPDGGDR